jgi:hypothetical protein
MAKLVENLVKHLSLFVIPAQHWFMLTKMNTCPTLISIIHIITQMHHPLEPHYDFVVDETQFELNVGFHLSELSPNT